MPDRDQEIIDSLRRAYEAFSRADFDAVMEIAHPEIEIITANSRLRSADALRAWMEPDAFEEQRMEPREFRIKGTRPWSANIPWPGARGAGSSWMSTYGSSGR